MKLKRSRIKFALRVLKSGMTILFCLVLSPGSCETREIPDIGEYADSGMTVLFLLHWMTVKLNRRFFVIADNTLFDFGISVFYIAPTVELDPLTFF